MAVDFHCESSGTRAVWWWWFRWFTIAGSVRLITILHFEFLAAIIVGFWLCAGLYTDVGRVDCLAD